MINLRRLCLKFLLSFISPLFLFLSPGYAFDVTLRWTANTENDLAGYKIYYDTDLGDPYEGTGALEGDSPVDMSLAQDESADPNKVVFTLHNLPDGTYYFAVTAYNDDVPPLESDYSSEVTADPTTDTTAPVISNIQVASTTDTTAVITWTSDEPSDSAVHYGTSSTTWENYPGSETDSSLVTNHSVTLTGLDGSTTYYFRVGSTDESGNGPTTSGQGSFTTDAPVDSTAPSIVQFPVVNFTNNTIDITYSESNMQNATTESNYIFSPSLLFDSFGGSDDIAFIGSNTYRLSMASVAPYLIYTVTVNNITDLGGNPVTPASMTFNDNDGDGMADDWETAYGVTNPWGDNDSDGLDNLDEYINDANPNDSDTDNDDLPDNWEVTYGLDPNDSTGANGKNGDLDNDGWTNYEEYSNGSNPASDLSSPQATPPVIKETIPKHNSGITDGKRIPIDTSFAVYFEDSDGIDITDNTSIVFTTDDGVNPVYERNLSHTDNVRVVKLTSDADTAVTRLWVVYDRSLDTYGNFAYDANVNIKVDAADRRGAVMAQAEFDFNIETSVEHNTAQATRPGTTASDNAGMTTLSIINEPYLDGFQVVYHTNEPVTPVIDPLDEIPQLNLPGVTPVDQPVKLGPPTVFNNPVKIIVPITAENDVRDLNVYLFDGISWVYAVSSYNTGGVIQPGGEGWVLPGSLEFDDTGNTPFLELQVYHFSGIQAGLVSLFSVEDIESGGGCFIDTISLEYQSGVNFSSNVIRGYMILFIILFLILLALAVLRWRSEGGSPI